VRPVAVAVSGRGLVVYARSPGSQRRPIFTSSSVREVLPVVALDGARVGRDPAADELQASLRRLAGAS
jgi:hypothetical protein